jgi:hypothetical protein
LLIPEKKGKRAGLLGQRKRVTTETKRVKKKFMNSKHTYAMEAGLGADPNIVKAKSRQQVQNEVTNDLNQLIEDRNVEAQWQNSQIKQAFPKGRW